ncbi:MAG: carboxypeptidase [Flavobacteriaceae bacterium]|nr:carboxypeptidase [Flavobacteriaceae bacterium]
MKTTIASFLVFLCFTTSLTAQKRVIPTDTTVVTTHTTTIKGKKIDYTAYAGTIPLWDKEGNPKATLFYTYYKRTNKVNTAKRPLLISFNGGPGSASVWMHLAYTGPNILTIDDEGYPVQPYGYKSNPYSILDVADIVFVNPVNTGYSRTVKQKGKKVNRADFFGVNADVKYLAEWVTTFVTRYKRWPSPKYLIGESYGGTRVSGLAHRLQSSQWMYLNGVILVSPADYGAKNSDNAVASSIDFPYFTAAAWYHKMLPPALQQKDLIEILPESEKFAINSLMPALAKGGFISENEKNLIAEKIAYYTGLSKKVILQHNLEIPNSFFWKELLRNKNGKTIGRLDSRYLGIDKKEAGDAPDYNSELTSWLHSFTPAINHYMQQHLKFKTDVKYNMFGPVHPWDWRNNNTREELRKAVAQNPYLHLLFQAGYYDGATTYFNTKYTMWQVDPSGKLKNRMFFKGYRSGHMMYLRKADLKAANEDIRNFIKASASKGKPAKY